LLLSLKGKSSHFRWVAGLALNLHAKTFLFTFAPAVFEPATLAFAAGKRNILPAAKARGSKSPQKEGQQKQGSAVWKLFFGFADN
jgi:hypothetical protein